jgi:cell division protein FtsB
MESNGTIMFGSLCSMKVRIARLGYIAAFLAVAGYAFVTLRGPRGIAALIEKQRQIAQLEKRNQQLHQEIERKREHIQRLENNETEQELEIRERLKLVHPKDKVFITGQPESK